MKEVFSSVLNVFAIIGLIAVAAFIIVFLTDLLISIIDGKNGIFFKRTKDKEEVKTLEMKDELEAKPQEISEEKPQELKGNVDMDLAASERLALIDEKTARAAQVEEQKVETLEETEEQEKELTDEELDRMYAELIADINKEEEEKEEDFDLDEDFEEEEPEVDIVEEEEDKTSLEEEIENLRKMLEAQEQEKEDLYKKLEAEQQEKENLTKQLEEKPQETLVVEGSLEDLEQKKLALEERLKMASKELKLNKKEYIPLARIKKTLENDEAKLRRREAIVAKKKIMLFGVTNYVVDPEKEKELSEDLDQLEALRLSVEHCQEVMTENKDRYPLLENTNKILTTSVDQIKADIEEIDRKISALSGNSQE